MNCKKSYDLQSDTLKPCKQIIVLRESAKVKVVIMTRASVILICWGPQNVGHFNLSGIVTTHSSKLELEGGVKGEKKGWEERIRWEYRCGGNNAVAATERG